MAFRSISTCGLITCEKSRREHQELFTQKPQPRRGDAISGAAFSLSAVAGSALSGAAMSSSETVSLFWKWGGGVEQQILCTRVLLELDELCNLNQEMKISNCGISSLQEGCMAKSTFTPPSLTVRGEQHGWWENICRTTFPYEHANIESYCSS